MNRSNSLCSIVAAVLVVSVSQARVGREYEKWAVGEFEMPEEIKSVTAVADLQAFLVSRREFTRMAAVRRLGEIKGADAIPTLLEAFAREPSPSALDYVPLVKIEVVRTLQRIGGDAGKQPILRLVEGHLQQGERLNRKDVTVRTDLLPVGRNLLSALETWRDDDDVFQTAKRAVTDTEGNERVPTVFGEQWWKLYLYGVISGRTGNKQADSDAAWYLLDVIQSASRQARDAKSLHRIKALAANNILKEMSPEVLSAAEEQARDEQRMLAELGLENERYESLNMAERILHEARTREAEGWTRKSRERAVERAMKEKQAQERQ